MRIAGQPTRPNAKEYVAARQHKPATIAKVISIDLLRSRAFGVDTAAEMRACP